MKFFVVNLLVILTTLRSEAFTVFSDRPLQSLASIITEFEATTNQKVTYVEESSTELLKKVKAGDSADIIIVKDIIFLNELVQSSLLLNISDESLFQSIHPSMVDPQRRWLPLSYRTRGLVYSQNLDANLLDSIQDYSDLAKPEFKGMLCVRTSNHSYNYGLGAYAISNMGFQNAIQMFTGWVSNLAKPPFNSDRAIISSVVNGECDLGIINSYYLGALLAENPNLAVGYKTFSDRTGGAHTNGSIIGIPVTSQDPSLAQRFIEISFRDEHQFHNSEVHFDYPAKLNVIPTYLPKTWHNPKLSNIPWVNVMENLKYVPELFQSAGYQ
jgi:iron(III) transport system substrate-binding protein